MCIALNEWKFECQCVSLDRNYCWVSSRVWFVKARANLRLQHPGPNTNKYGLFNKLSFAFYKMPRRQFVKCQLAFLYNLFSFLLYIMSKALYKMYTTIYLIISLHIF